MQYHCKFHNNGMRSHLCSQGYQERGILSIHSPFVVIEWLMWTGGVVICRPFEDAFRAFSSIGPNGTSAQQQGSTLLAVRCGLAFSSTMADLRNFQDAAACNARTANFCDPVLGAMLLEQVAICHACKSPPQMRAALRYAMLAGQRYSNARLPGLAAVCFKAVATHHGDAWPAVTRTLAEQASAACEAKARWVDSVQYLCSALGAADVQASSGEEHLKTLQSLWYMVSKAKEVGQDLSMDQHLLSLKVPCIDTHAYSVSLTGLQVMALCIYL
jgi:hypothetical protein